MKQTVETLTAGAKTDMDRIKSLFYYVSKKVRYMGLTPEKDRPGFEPHDVKITFDKKYGVCRDKAALLVSMLRDRRPQRLSGADQRRHSNATRKCPTRISTTPLSACELKPGDYLLMDPTDENTRDAAALPAIATRATWSAGPRARTSRSAPFSRREDNLMRVRHHRHPHAATVISRRNPTLCFDGVNDDMLPQRLRRT